MLIAASERKIGIPKHLKDIDTDWVLALVCIINNVQDENIKIQSISINHRSNSEEGVLSDTCKIFIHAERSTNGTFKPRPLIHNLFIKIIPEHLRSMVTNNRLFEKELIFYSKVVPLLQEFALSKGKTLSKLKHLSIPKFLYGDVNDEGQGVIVLEDMSVRGFRLFDTSLLMFGYSQLSVALGGLAEYHALVLAFDILSPEKLVEKFPIFDSQNLLWVQDEMLKFLESIVKVASVFINSIPGEETNARKFLKALQHPREILESEQKNFSTKFQMLQHADSWHNNFMFNKPRQATKISLVDWQMTHYGNGINDVTFLIFSSTSSEFRRKHLEKLLNFYFDTLMKTVRSFGVTADAFDSTYQEFVSEFNLSLKYCLLFSANANDLNVEDQRYFDTSINNKSQGVIGKKPLIASDKDIDDLERRLNGEVGIVIDQERAAKIRRRNFLDICREAASQGII